MFYKVLNNVNSISLSLTKISKSLEFTNSLMA